MGCRLQAVGSLGKGKKAKRGNGETGRGGRRFALSPILRFSS